MSLVNQLGRFLEQAQSNPVGGEVVANVSRMLGSLQSALEDDDAGAIEQIRSQIASYDAEALIRPLRSLARSAGIGETAITPIVDAVRQVQTQLAGKEIDSVALSPLLNEARKLFSQAESMMTNAIGSESRSVMSWLQKITRNNG